jgi:ClpP class serine protease
MSIHRIARNVGRPLLMTEAAARELAQRAIKMDARALDSDSLTREPGKVLTRVGVAQQLRPAAYTPSYAGEPEHYGAGWALCEGIACIDIEGPLMDRGFVTESGTRFWGYDTIGQALKEAYADPRTRGIFVRFNTPGGIVAGTLEALTADIRAMREAGNDNGKPMFAFCDMAASAGYWVASQFDRVFAPAVGMVGSIGAVIVHQEFSKAMEAEGIVTTSIQFGAKKTDGAWWKPLSDEARADLQAEIDAIGERFISDVQAGREFLSRATMLGTEAACFMAEHSDAARSGFKLGLVDEIAREEDAFHALFEHAARNFSVSVSQPISASRAAPAPVGSAQSQSGAQSSEKSMNTKQARIDAVMARKTLSADEKLRKIAAINAEEESTEDEDLEAEDEETEEDPTTAEEGDEDETEETTAEDEEDADPEAEDEDEEEPTAKKAAARLKSARNIAKSKEAKANPAFALNAIANGVTFAAFKAMAPAAGKGSGFASRMGDEPSARRLGDDAPQATRSNGNGKVVKLKTPGEYYAAAEGKKKSG